MSQRGDVILVEIPYYDQAGSKVRPAVVVQWDRNNRKLRSTLVVVVTTNIRRVRVEPTQFLIDPAPAEGSSSGLTTLSAVKCENIFTVAQDRIRSFLGHLSDPMMQKLNGCLKIALELP